MAMTESRSAHSLNMLCMAHNAQQEVEIRHLNEALPLHRRQGLIRKASADRDPPPLVSPVSSPVHHTVTDVGHGWCWRHPLPSVSGRRSHAAAESRWCPVGQAGKQYTHAVLMQARNEGGYRLPFTIIACARLL